jgi:hypothetical protein
MPAEAHVSGKETTAKAHPHKVPLGPRMNPLSFLSSLLFGSPSDLLGLYTSAAREFGDVVRFPGGPLTATFSITPITVSMSCKIIITITPSSIG